MNKNKEIQWKVSSQSKIITATTTKTHIDNNFCLSLFRCGFLFFVRIYSKEEKKGGVDRCSTVIAKEPEGKNILPLIFSFLFFLSFVKLHF